MKISLLDTILDPDQLSVRFQPIFQVRSGSNRIHALEALIRGPQGTNFEPADVLFDYVRRKRAEALMDRSCVAAICDAAVNLPPHFRINVNVHATTLGHKPGFVEFFRNQVRMHRLELERFTIEMVEHAPTCNIPGLVDSMTTLRDLGVRIALDDVGLGQSNYRMMLDCHPEYFKLDSYFVRGVSTDPKRRAVVESVVALAAAMESSVVAEGVESRQDLAALGRLGIELVQANLLCQALPLEDLLAMGLLKNPKDTSASATQASGSPDPQAFGLEPLKSLARVARQSS